MFGRRGKHVIYTVQKISPCGFKILHRTNIIINIHISAQLAQVFKPFKPLEAL